MDSAATLQHSLGVLKAGWNSSTVIICMGCSAAQRHLHPSLAFFNHNLFLEEKTQWIFKQQTVVYNERRKPYSYATLHKMQSREGFNERERTRHDIPSLELLWAFERQTPPTQFSSPVYLQANQATTVWAINNYSSYQDILVFANYHMKNCFRIFQNTFEFFMYFIDIFYNIPDTLGYFEVI